MLMVIFGAGASFDSSQAHRVRMVGSEIVHDCIWRPPLANDLFLDRHRRFGNIIQSYPKIAHILPRLRERPNGVGVEEFLESLVAERNPESQREFASVRYYLCDLLTVVGNHWIADTHGVTNYSPLIRDILLFTPPAEPICLVTFNYDLLLENALYSFGYTRKDPEHQFESHQQVKLFKLHGSVEWARKVETPSNSRLLPQHLIQTVDSLKLTEDFVLANSTNHNEMFNFDKPIFPAIAIPVQNKTDDTFECPRSHRQYLYELLPSITKILIVGWQGREAHFTSRLKTHLSGRVKLLVVTGSRDNGKKMLDHFVAQVPNRVSANSVVYDGGFTDFVIKGNINEFLAS